ncbi:MAG: tRNA lysidine(34) synthetase TilS [Clostridia bacterium]|nr:tRNA lysidine(34) synthetase TilS [Clostridia bacterium]
MDNILKTIKEKKLISPGDVIGVAVSGGSDSMALLHYLNELSSELDFEIVAVHVDHCIRTNSADDAAFVMDYCKEQMIRSYKFKVNVPQMAQQKKTSLEEVARDARFGVFDALLRKGVVGKIAIAHHSRDQAETILINLFRGSGVTGAVGMEASRDGFYLRPMLDTSKDAILNYIHLHAIPFVEDETNKDNVFSRNYIRNLILPLIEERWPGAVEKIVNFGKDCADDNQYINEQILTDAIIFEKNTAKIPQSYFLYPKAIVSRIIFRSLEKIKAKKDIERVHIQMIKKLAQSGENGKKINLPNSITVFKEYDYITITNKKKEIVELNEPFKSGSFQVKNYGTVSIKKVKDFELQDGELLVDFRKIPKNAVWRLRQKGDTFNKFGGGGSKKLRAYLIDKKVPNRIRTSIPVLAVENEILVIAGVEISESVRVDSNTLSAAKISVTLD